MGQIDRETDAALAQLNFDALSQTPGGEFVEIVGDLLKLVGGGGPLGVAGGISSLIIKVRKLAGASYASNLIYAITAVRNDLATLYERHEELRGRIESLGDDSKFAGAIAALALRAMQTSVESRLERLALIVANGVKNDDLNPESLDDMMRHAVELKDADIALLGKICNSQGPLLRAPNLNPITNWLGQVKPYWDKFISSGALDQSKHLEYRSSLSRLESQGLIQKYRDQIAPVGQEPYALLEEGLKFYERLQDIGAKNSGQP